MITLKKCIWFAREFLVPRFITEDVALEYSGNGETTDFDNYEIVCSMQDIQPGESFDAVATVDSFSWMGFGTTYRIGNCRKWSIQ